MGKAPLLNRVPPPQAREAIPPYFSNEFDILESEGPRSSPPPPPLLGLNYSQSYEHLEGILRETSTNRIDDLPCGSG